MTSRTLCRIAALALGFGTGSLAAVSSARATPNVLRTYPVPAGLLYSAHNDDFTVRVRAPGGDWQDLYEYRVQVDADTRQNASLVYFDFTGTVEVEVLKNNGSFATVSVAPLSSRVRTSRSGMVTRFTLSGPERFSLQFDDDRLHNLHIVAGKLPSPRPTGAAVRYFGPGLHVPPDGDSAFAVRSGERIHLDGGCVTGGLEIRSGVDR